MRPTEDGIGLQRAIREALAEAGVDLEKDKIDLFNCHATSTPLGDASEAEAIFKLIGDKDISKRAIITALKGNLGHMGAGAAIAESIMSMKSIETGSVPQISNLAIDCSCRFGGRKAPEPSFLPLNFAVDSMSNQEINTVVKNTLCFGGMNMSAVFRRYN